MQPGKDTTATLGFKPAKAYPVFTDGQAGKLKATIQSGGPSGGPGARMRVFRRPGAGEAFQEKVNRQRASFQRLQPESPGTQKSHEDNDNHHHNSLNNCFGSEFFRNLWTGTQRCQENLAAHMEFQP